MKTAMLLYFFSLTIPVFLGIAAWQSNRFSELEWEIAQLERSQEEWVESNKRLIAGIAVLSSSERIAYIAKHDLGLIKKRPEEVLQIRIEGGRKNDG
ncbi:MAG: cell division protein FtsL [Treponema sp.]|jgi:cell division protein FtsL|nr:cell division protein FtsL [Treponema sp.]